MIILRNDLNQFFNELLSPQDFIDYGPNGLQVEGHQSISKIAFAVSATAHSIGKAIELGADSLIVHHGLFWKFHGAKTLTGAFYKRVAPLIKNNINLFSFHLPLDAHLEIGNAASLAREIKLTNLQPFGNYKGAPTGVSGVFPDPLSPKELKTRLEKILHHQVLHAAPQNKNIIQSMGIITGGANGEWAQALNKNFDSYLTGEMSEHDWHESQEAGIHMFAGGHHATERFGIQSLMGKVENHFQVEVFYIESLNPA